MKLVITYLIGLMFGTGLAISGMINPAKVLNFFDFAGTWDPSLIFVMGGALVVTGVGYQIVFRRDAPMIASSFHLPSLTQIDVRLVAGSATFGVGWGISGFCPGPAISALSIGNPQVFIFVGAMVVGLFGARAMLRWNNQLGSTPAA